MLEQRSHDGVTSSKRRSLSLTFSRTNIVDPGDTDVVLVKVDEDVDVVVVVVVVICVVADVVVALVIVVAVGCVGGGAAGCCGIGAGVAWAQLRHSCAIRLGMLNRGRPTTQHGVVWSL